MERLSEEALLRYAGEIDGAICGDDPFNARVLDACFPRLKVISKWETCIDSIDQQAADGLGIQVYNTPGVFTDPVADSVMSYILAFARQGPWMYKSMKAGHWEKIKGQVLDECTLGMVGVGNVGKAVLCRARAYGMLLLGNDNIEVDPEFVS